VNGLHVQVHFEMTSLADLERLLIFLRDAHSGSSGMMRAMLMVVANGREFPPEELNALLERLGMGRFMKPGKSNPMAAAAAPGVH
jgi:hypothetical protein